MKIAIAGKGGVGKTTISGTLCRILGKKGIAVLAIDGDPNPNLSLVLGIGRDIKPPPPLSADGVLERVEDPDGKRYIQLKMPLQEVLKTYGQTAPDNVTLLMVGQPDHAGTGCMCSSHTAVREVIHAAMTEGNQMTILDTEASLELLKRGTPKYVDTMFVVVEPYYRSLEAAGRFFRLAKELGVEKVYAIANKVQNTDDEAAIRQFCTAINLPVSAIIPFDTQITEADLKGQSIMDYAAESKAVGAIRDWADRTF